MSQAPTPYVPDADFSTLAATPITSAGLPGTQLDSEFAEIAATLTATQARLAELQRDDGAVRNGVVGFLAMSADVLAAFASIGSNYRGQWSPGQNYVSGDLVISGIDNYPYLCGEPHTSSASFESDFSAGVWAILGYRPTTDSLVVNTFSGTGAQTAFSLTKNPVDENNTQVYVAGVYQKKSAYSIAGTSPAVLTFGTAPASGTDNIEVVIGVSAELINNVVTIPNNSVGTAAILNSNVTTGKLADLSVTTDKISALGVTTGKLADLSVTTGKIAALAVTGDKIAGATIDSTKLAASAVQTANIQAGAVENSKLGAASVDAVKLATAAVTTGKILDLNVTTAKIAELAVSADKIASDAVTTAKILDANVTTSKILDANITASKLSGAQTGTAPIFAARAWMAMKSVGSARTADGKTLAISNTSAGVCTVTYPSHGFKTGHQFWFQFSSLIVSKVYTVTVVNANSFTVQTTYLTATTTPTVSIALYNVLGSGNVNSVSSHNSLETNPAYLIVNLNEPMPDNRYAIISTNSYTYPNVDDTDTSPSTYNPSPNQTTNSFRLVNGSTSRYINMVVFG